ncbi:bacteriohemerythrin [Clostridium oryzae]|uniref:Bacteriohemerythrin n=1 Tax=Clostridium oryzae TaxID=1450648 RepID=A0A1V4IKG6_9CLOT|nr:hemerythrin family protein [Clostridium oryzae]OPJ60330.1 bacteriohemerythrin [Clostridium oryzae]
MIKWKDEYLVGITEIDEQHKKIFEIGERAYELLKNEIYIDKYDRIIAVINELREYAAFHFKWEEGYMTKIGYKRFFSQKVEHDEFIKKINSVDLEKVDMNQDEYLLSIIEFIINWIGEHIIEKDKLIAESR